MKKIFKSVICIMLIVSFAINSVLVRTKAAELENSNNSNIYIQESKSFQSFITSYLSTNEPSMPNNASKNSDAYSSWLNNVVKINEEHYGQKVEKIEDNDRMTVIYFEQLDESNAKQYYDEETGKTVYVVVDKIEYDKTKNTFENSLFKNNNVKSQESSVYASYKFTYYHAWDSGLYEDSRKTGLLSTIGQQILDYALKTGDKTINTIVSLVLGSAINNIDRSRSITAISMNTYYYYNKVCSIKVSNLWVPNVWIGSRYIYSYYIVKAYYPSGQPYPSMESEPKEANGTPPTNADNQHFKSNYNNNTWIKNKSSEMLAAGITYTDVFGYAINPVN